MSLRALLILLAALLLTACGGSKEAAAPEAASETIGVSEAHGRQAKGEVLLVDVRTDEEWSAGRAPDALHVPLPEVERRLEEIEREAGKRQVAFICRSGRRSAEAAQIAVAGGLEDAVSVGGGMGEWKQAGLPLAPETGRII